MPSFRELSAPYDNFMLSPRLGPGVCRFCFNLTAGYERCYACIRQPQMLDAFAPISYSVAHEQLHHALASYKRMTGGAARRLSIQLAAILWRFIAEHEHCVANAAAVSGFPLVTTVPSGDRDRDERHPLRWIVSELIGPTRERHQRLIERTSTACDPRAFSPDKFATVRPLGGEPVLLIDDTWTTGASAQSAAAALKDAGAGPVGAVVIGRHVSRCWHENDRRLRGLTQPFDSRSCTLCRAVENGRTEATAA